MTSWPSARSTITGRFAAYDAICVKPCHTTAASRSTHSSCVLIRRCMLGPVTQADPLTVRDRVLAAAYTCVTRFGLAKTTIEDVVKESGVSRATIYRHFPGGRDELLQDPVGWELSRYFPPLAAAVRDAPDPPPPPGDGLVFARRSVLEHEV